MPLTLTEEPNFLRPCLSATFQRLFLLSNNGVANFLKQTKKNNPISEQKYEALKIGSVTTLHVLVFASAKSDIFIQIFLLGL